MATNDNTSNDDLLVNLLNDPSKSDEEKVEEYIKLTTGGPVGSTQEVVQPQDNQNTEEGNNEEPLSEDEDQSDLLGSQTPDELRIEQPGDIYSKGGQYDAEKGDENITEVDLPEIKPGPIQEPIDTRSSLKPFINPNDDLGNIGGYNKLKSKYKLEDQSDEEFFNSIKPGVREVEEQFHGKYGWTHTRKSEVETYGGVTYEEDPKKFEEFKYLYNQYKRALETDPLGAYDYPEDLVGTESTDF